MVQLWGVFMYRLMTGLRPFLDKLFKNCLHHLCGAWLLYGNVQPIPSWQSKISLRAWMRTAWGGFSSESVINRFMKCCLSNGTEDILWEEDDGCRQLFE